MTGFATHRALPARSLGLFAAQLEQQRRFRLEQLRDHARAQSAQSVARAATPVEREISETLVRGARAALAEIDAARARLADGSYGHCVDCGVAVPIERLEVLPQVARCLACDRAMAGQ